MDVKRDSEQKFDNEVEELPAPTYHSPLLALLQEPSGPPKLIEIPEPSPAIAERIRQMEERKEREVGTARDRAYEDDGGLLAQRGIGRPIRDSELSPVQLSELNRLRKEWLDWHEDPANADWRPDGGDLDVGGLP
jgi:hypothetical protein